MNRYLYVAVFLLIAIVGLSKANKNDIIQLADSPEQSTTAKQLNAGQFTKVKSPAPVTERGQLLYENHCSGCHEESVHNRSTNKATSIAEVQTWVTRWSLNLELGWDKGDINVVTEYLNRRYYQFTAE